MDIGLLWQIFARAFISFLMQILNMAFLQESIMLDLQPTQPGIIRISAAKRK